MSEQAAPSMPGLPIEAVLRDELARADLMLGTIPPILRHLLSNDDHSLFSDEIIARVRGMVDHVVAQLLDLLTAAGGQEPSGGYVAEQRQAMVAALVGDGRFTGHVHALALEWQLTARLEAQLGLDPVLSPLLQALIASPDSAMAGSGMALLAAQARFTQAQRRMQLPLAELPGEQLHLAILVLRAAAGPRLDLADQAEAQLRSQYDESRSRLGLLARIVTGMGPGATAALAIGHGGVALFLSAMAIASAQDRDLVVLSTNEGQLARLALGLRACGVKPAAIEEQFLALHPETTLPTGFDRLGSDQASALLAQSAVVIGA